MKRGKTGWYRGKRASFKKFTHDCKIIINAIKEKGSCSYSELIRYTKIPRGTIDRRLKHLKGLGVIINVKKRWMLADYAKTYKNINEHKIFLVHSQQLIKGILAINEFLEQFIPRSDFYAGNILTELKRKLRLRSNREMWPYALQHIKTGYPQIFELLRRCTYTLVLIQNVEAESQKRILKKIEITNEAESWEDSLAISDQKRLELENEAAQLRNMLEDELTKLILKVKNGEPLGGKCDICPKIFLTENEKSEGLHAF